MGGANLKVLVGKITDNFRTGKVKSKRSIERAPNELLPVYPKPDDAQVLAAFRVPSELAFAGRAITQLTGVGLLLDENWEFVDRVADEAFKMLHMRLQGDDKKTKTVGPVWIDMESYQRYRKIVRSR